MSQSQESIPKISPLPLKETSGDAPTQAHSSQEPPKPAPQQASSGSRSSVSNRAVILADDTLAPGETRKVQADALTNSSQPEDRYVVSGEFARGGLGRIIRAKDQRLGRAVAIKEMLKPAVGEAEARFLREARITAKLEHPSIIPVHDLGRWSSGASYYAMKLVSGRSFDKVIAQAKTIEERLALLPHAIDACEAMAYAHSQRIIHRDLKPHNILVGPFGETVVIDWGIAKELKAGNGEWGTENGEQNEDPNPYREENEEAALTKAGAILGTPAYMPLEQAKGNCVDERVDVYALGAILYHMLSGAPPFVGKKSLQVLRALVDGPPVPLLEKNSDLPKDLVDIVEKAMSREAAHRYPSAKELAQDLKNFQTGQLVGAHRYSSWELLTRFVQKNKTAVLIGSLSVMLLGVALTWGYVGTHEEWRRAEREKKNAITAQEKTQILFEEAEKKRQLEAVINEDFKISQAKAELRQNPAKSIAWLKTLRPNIQQPDWSEVSAIAQEALSRGVPTVLGASWDKSQKALLGKGADWFAASPDGQYLATAGKDGQVKLWDLTNNEVVDLYQHQKGSHYIVFSPAGRFVASADKSPEIKVFDVKGGEFRNTFSLPGGVVYSLSFSADERFLAAAVQGQSKVFLWNVATGKEVSLPMLHEQEVRKVAFSSKDLLLATAGADGKVILWDVETNTQTELLGHRSPLVGLKFSDDGSLLASSSLTEDEVILWDVSTHKKRLSLPVDATAGLEALAISPSGRFVAASGQDAVVTLVDLSLCQLDKCQPQNLRGHIANVLSLAFSPDETLLATSSEDHTIRLWETNIPASPVYQGQVLLGHSFPVQRVSFSNDTLISVDRGGNVFLWKMKELSETAWYPKIPEEKKLLMLGDSVLMIGDGGIFLEPGKEPSKPIALQEKHWYRGIVSSGDFFLAEINDETGVTSVHRWSPGGELKLIFQSKSVIGALHEYQDTLVTLEEDLSIRFYDKVSGQQREEIKQKKASTASLVAGNLLYSCERDGTLRIFDLSQKKELSTVTLASFAEALALSADGTQLAAGESNGTIEVFSLPSLVLQKTLSGHKGKIRSLLFSGSKQLISGSQDRSVRSWSLLSDASQIISEKGWPIWSLVVSSDASALYAADEHALRKFSLQTIPSGEALLSWLSKVSTAPLQ
jgi:WD40 repeat protein/serine/threonine protein kinase